MAAAFTGFNYSTFLIKFSCLSLSLFFFSNFNSAYMFKQHIGDFKIWVIIKIELKRLFSLLDFDWFASTFWSLPLIWPLSKTTSAHERWNRFFSSIFSPDWIFFSSFRRGIRFASSDICSVRSCEAWGQTHRSTKRFYFQQRVGEGRRLSSNTQPGRGRCNWQMYNNTESNSAYAKGSTLCGLFLFPSGADRRSPLTLRNGRAKQICTAALPTVQKSQILQSAAATLGLEREATRPRSRSRAPGWNRTFSCARFTICSEQKKHAGVKKDSNWSSVFSP